MKAEKALNHSQQEGLFDPAYAKPVTMIGFGAVGSVAARTLIEMGVSELTGYDHDYVESHNSPMSEYDPEHLSRYKVDAIREILERTSPDISFTGHKKRYAGEPLSGAVIACVDSMEARQEIWKAVRKNAAVEILIDTRVADRMISVFAINPLDEEDIAYYEYHLRYSSNEAVRPTCGNHGLKTVSLIAAARACDLLTNWWTEGRKKRHHVEYTDSMVISQPEQEA